MIVDPPRIVVPTATGDQPPRATGIADPLRTVARTVVATVTVDPTEIAVATGTVVQTVAVIAATANRDV